MGSWPGGKKSWGGVRIPILPIKYSFIKYKQKI